MNTLYFVKFVTGPRQSDDIVFCLTADNETQATEKGFAMIHLPYRDLYKLERVDAICQTPDTVDCFEPC